MKYIKKYIYFRNVFIFIDRVKNVIRVKEIKLLRDNL